MKKIIRVNCFKVLLSFVFIAFLGLGNVSKAQSVWNGSLSSDWNVAVNWTPSGVPVKTNDVLIPSGTPNALSINANVECQNITINSGATVNFVTGVTLPGYIGVYGDFSNAGLITNSSSAGFNIYMLNNTGAQSISNTGDMTACKLAVYFGTNVTLLTNVSVAQFLVEDVTDPNLALREYTIISNVKPNVFLGNKKLTVGTYFYQYGNFYEQTGTLELSNGADSPYLTSATFFAESGLTWYNNTDPTSTVIFVTGGVTYNNLQLSLNGVTYAEIGLPNEADNNSNGAITCTGNMIVDGAGSAGLAFNLTVNGNLSIGTDITFNPNGMVNSSYSNLTLKGDLVNDGIFNGVNGPAPTGGGTFTFAGTTTQNISGAGSEIYFALIINNTSPTGIILHHDFQVSRTMTMQAGNFNLNGSNISFRGNGTLAGESETTRIFGASGTIYTTARTGAQGTGNIAGFGANITTTGNPSIVIARGHTIQNINGKSSIARYYDITPIPDAGLNASFGFSYFNKEKNGLDKNKLTMFRSNDGGITWDLSDCTQQTTVKDTTNKTVTQTGIATLKTRWTLAESGKLSGTAVKDTSICLGGTAKLKLVNNLASTIQWQTSLNGSSAWADVSGATTVAVSVSPAVTSFYRAIVSNTTCSDTSNNVKVTILPTAVAGTAKSDQTICSGISTTVQLTGSTGSIQWQDSTVSGMWANIAGATTANYTTPILNQTTYYRAKVTIGSCPVTSNVVTITVNPSVVAGTAGNNATICNGSTTTLNVTGSTGNIQWQDSSKTSSGTWNNIVGETNPSLTTASLTDTTYYRVKVSNANSTCFDVSNKVKVSVVPLEIAGTASGNTTICSGNTTGLLLSGYTGNIQWQDSTSGGMWTDIAGATTANYTTKILNTTTYFRARVYFSTCNAYSNIVTITVNPAAIAGTSSPDMLLCTGNSAVVQLTGSSGNIQWQDSSKTSIGVWNNIAGATGTSYTTPALTDTVFYRAVLENGTATCFDTSRVIAINIISSIMVGTAAADSAICSGTSAILRLIGSLGSVQWQDSSATSGGVWNDIIGATTKRYTTGGLNDSTYFRAKVFAGSGCSDTTNAIKIAVYPSPIGGIAGPNASVCTSTGTTINLMGYTGNIQWQDSTNATAGVWVNIAGETNPVLNTAALIDTTYFRAMLTNVATISCSSTSNTVKITVSPKPTAGLTSADTSICYNSTAKLRLKGSFGNVQWQDSTSISGVWTNVASATDSMFTTPSLTDTTYYRAVLSTAGCFNDTSMVIKVSVKPQAVAGTISNDTTICAGGTATIVLKGSAGSIQWQTSFDNVTYTDSTGEVKDTLLVMQPGGVKYYKAVVNSFGCLAYSLAEKVTVTPTSIAGVISNDTSLCYGSSAYVHIKNYRGNIQWQTSVDSVTFGNAIGETLDSIQVDVTTTKYYRAVLTNGVCSSAISAIQKTTVSPTSTSGSISSSQTICKGNTTILRLSGSVGVIQWQAGGNSSSYADSIGANTDTLIVSPQGKRYYRVIVTSGSCSPDISNPVIINVDTPPVAGTASGDQTICKGSAAKIYLTGNSGSIQWQTSDDGLSFADSTGATLDSITVSPYSTRYYRAQSENGVCNPVSSNAVTITVNQPSYAGVVTGTDTICKGSSKTLSTTASIGTLQWQVSNDNISYTDSIGATTSSISVMPSSTRYYRVLAKNGVCKTDTSLGAKVTIFVPNIGGTASSPDVCSGSRSKLMLTGYNGIIQWQKSADSLAWSNIPGATTTPYTIKPLVTTYYRAVLSDGGVCANDTSKAIKVKVIPAAVADSVVADNPNTCYGNSTRIRLVGNTGTVQWQDSSVTSSGIWQNIAGQTATSYYTPALTNTIYYRAVVTNGMCFDTSKVAKVTVIPAVNAGMINSHDSICIGTIDTLVIKGYTGNPLKWMSSTDNFSYSTVTASNNDTIILSPTVTTYYKAVVTNGLCYDTTAAFKLTVNPLTVAGSALSSRTHCSGTASVISVTGYVGTLQWQSSTNNITFNNIVAATANTLTVSPTITTFYRVKVTSGKCSTLFTNTIKLTVVQGSVAGTATAAKSTVCVGSPANITLTGNIGTIQWQKASAAAGPWSNIIVNGTFATYSGAVNQASYFRAIITNGSCDSTITNVVFINTISGVAAGIIKSSSDTICVGGSVIFNVNNSVGAIQWQASFTTTNWQNIANATNTQYITGALTKDTYFRVVVNNGSCTDTTALYKIVVNTPPVGGAIASYQNLCYGDNASIILNNYSGNIQWQSTHDITFTDLKFEVNNTLVVTPFVTTFYRAKVSTVGCSAIAYSNIDTVRVLPLSVSGVVNIDRTVRPGVSALISVKGFIGNIQWQQSADSITFTDIVGANGALIEVNPTKNTYYRIVSKSALCTSISNVVRVTVDFFIFGISPVPATNEITVKFNLPENQRITYKVYDMLGKIVLQKEADGIQGDNILIVDISGLSSGGHYMIIENNSTLIKGKFIKQ